MAKIRGKEDKRYGDTRLLLHALGGGLRLNIENSIYTAEELERLEVKMLLQDRDPDAYIEALRGSKTRSEILLVNAERLFEAWERSRVNADQRRRRKIVRMWYFEKRNAKEVSAELNTPEAVVIRELGTALDELSVCFFGADGIERISRKGE